MKIGKLEVKLNELNLNLHRYFYIEQILAVFIACLIILLPVSVVDAIVIKDRTVTPDKDFARVTFTTDVDSTAEIQYGLTAAKDSTAKSSITSRVHTINLAPLKEGERYFYKIIARDNKDNPAPTQDEVFYTLDNVAPLKVSNLKNISATTKSIKLTWDSVLPDTRKGLPGDKILINTLFLETELK